MGRLGGPRCNHDPNRNGKSLFDFTVKYNLISVNSRKVAVGPTTTFFGPIGSSVIDHILVPDEVYSVTTSSRVLLDDPLNVSDHYPVSMEANLGVLKANLASPVKAKLRKWD